jgi:hypothetical protein
MRGTTGSRADARRRRRFEAARYLSVAIGLAILAAVIVPLAREGITRAEAGSSHGTATAATATRRATSALPGADAPTPPQATLTIGPDLSAVPVPRSYFGISTEYWSLTPKWFEVNTPVFERVLRLLHVRGDGPLVVRIGGDSADHSFWKPPSKSMPDWAFELTPGYLARLSALVKRDRVKLIIDLNVVTDTPLTAAARARAAETSLPRGSIVGFEIGNEPDLYSHRFWMAMTASSPLKTLRLPLELTPDIYVQNFAAYARVLGENAPDIPLIGPAVAYPRVNPDYITMLVADEGSELGAVSAHVYPYSRCIKNPRSPEYPTVMRLLSHQAVSAFSTDIAQAVAVAHANNLKFRLTEFNSVTCGGKRGVSDTFATALWAPDALFTAMRAGADGANLHVRAMPTAINAPFAITKGGLEPRPLLYGLMLFNRTLGPQARLVRLHLVAARALNLSAWAVEVRGRILNVLLIDKGSRRVRVDLHLPAVARASVQQLLAPSPYSRSGVTLDGQRLNHAARWVGAKRTDPVPHGGRGYTVVVPQRSAALFSVVMGTLRRASRRVVSEHHGRGAVTKHSVVTVSLDRPSKH